jgi:tetratricopeptide (TPR) repeat protein
MEINENVKAALIGLDLADGASMTDIRTRYLDLTSMNKFEQIFISDDKLKKEFVKYHTAYITLIKNFSSVEFDSESDMGFYPTDHVFHLHLNQGIYHMINLNYIKAGEKFQQAYNIDSQNITVKLYMGLLLLKRKNYYAAEKYFREATKLDNNSDDAWFYLGECYFKAGELKKAIPMYETAKRINPGRHEIAFRLQEIFEKLGMKVNAKRYGSKRESVLGKIIKKFTGGA